MEKIIILDFGSQYTQLIARSVRACHNYCEIIPFYKTVDINDSSIKGIILSGSPYSTKSENAPTADIANLHNYFPILGVCYGAQLIVSTYGGTIQTSNHEYGKANLQIKQSSACALLRGIKQDSIVWMSHGESITSLPASYQVLASTDNAPIVAFEKKEQTKDLPMWGVQFHPEVHHSEDGRKIIANFLTHACQCKNTWTPTAFIQSTVASIQKGVGDSNVLMALSGGVDSTVAAVLLHKAIGPQLHAVCVNNGLLRKNEFSDVLRSYQNMQLNISGIDKTTHFLVALKGVTAPERKRKIIGHLFIDSFEQFAKTQQRSFRYLGQGTTYPDVIESVSVQGPSVTIKSHHNVGGLPKKMNLDLLEPLRYLFKDEVRSIGLELGVDEHIIHRHPFPGPGLGIRILGEVTEEKVARLQEADAIFCERLKQYNLYQQVWQAGAILLPVQSVGVMGDGRTYEHTIALRAVTSVDGMTADWARLPDDFLADVSSTIINQVQGVNRVVYDISSKPPATIEWE